LEEEIIKKDILPVLSRTIEPALQLVKHELVLVVDYLDGHPLSVHLSRKHNFTANLLDAKEMILFTEVNHKKCNSNSENKIERGPARDMSILFPGKTIIEEKTAADTLVAFVKKIGMTKVCKVVEDNNLRFCKVPVISNRRDAKYGKSQKDLGDGWLLITHSNNIMKKSFIEKVSITLDLGVKVILKI